MFEELDAAEDARRDENFIAARALGFVPEREVPSIRRLFAMSDVHCDHAANLDFIRSLEHSEYGEDALILAGDISHEMQVIRETLVELKARFSHVLYTTGNHELWLKNDSAYKKGVDCPYTDSVQKLKHILQLCDELSVITRPAVFESGGEVLWVCPLLAWHSQSFDDEPGLDEFWDDIPPVEKNVMDYSLCIWPKPLDPGTDSVAAELDRINEENWALLPPEDLEAVRTVAAASAEERENGATHLVTFSHFVPRLEVNPEKRILFYPNMAKAIGSPPLRRRVALLRPDVHVFGHTHFGWDAVVEGTRFVQAPLSMPRERDRLPSTAIGYYPDFTNPKPLLLRDGDEWADTYDAAFSRYYSLYSRDPTKTRAGSGPIYNGNRWKGPGPMPTIEDVFEGRPQPWEFSPDWIRIKVGMAGQ